MQRRAAAVYFILFVAIGAGAYGFIQVGMSEPTVDLDGPTLSEGDELTVDGQAYTVSSIDTGEGEVARYGGDVELSVAGSDETVTLSAGENGTLNGVDHFAHFPSETQVQILQTDASYSVYTGELAAIEYWDERRNGVWGIVILSVLAGFVLLSTAYLPLRG